MITKGESRDEKVQIQTTKSHRHLMVQQASWFLPAFQPAAWELTAGIQNSLGNCLHFWFLY